MAVIAVLVGGVGFYVSDKIYLRADHAEVTHQDFARKIQPTVLKRDITAMVQMMQHVHPDFDVVVDRPSFIAQQSAVIGKLTQPMTRVEFWREAALINAAIRDGHTSLWTPDEEWSAAKAGGFRTLPIAVVFDDGGGSIARSFAAALPSDARIEAINGIPMAAIRSWITDRISGENEDFRRSYGAERFAKYSWLMGLKAPFDVRWSNGSNQGSTRVPGVAVKQLDELLQRRSSSSYGLEFADRTAILRIDSFEKPQREYEAFLERSFAEIARRRPAALILDIRHNTGGESSQGDLLQSYLSDSTLPALKSVSVKTTAEVKARYRTLMPPGFRWIPLNSLEPTLRGIQQSPDGGIYTFHPEGAEPSKRNSPRETAYHGPLYILVSPETYSSAAIFVAPLSYWRRAVLIGQPTGEPLNFFGDNYQFDLPSSRLQASVSHKEFRLFGRGDPRAGVQPDVPIPPGEDAMSVARQLIARKANRR